MLLLPSVLEIADNRLTRNYTACMAGDSSSLSHCDVGFGVSEAQVEGRFELEFGEVHPEPRVSSTNEKFASCPSASERSMDGEPAACPSVNMRTSSRSVMRWSAYKMRF